MVINTCQLLFQIFFVNILVADRRNKINEQINAKISIGIFNINQEIDDQVSINDEYISI